MTNQGDENDNNNNNNSITPSGVAAAIQAFEGRLSSSQHNQQPLSPVPPTPKNKVLYQQSSLRSISSPYRERGPSGYASPNSSKVSSLHHSAPNLDTTGEMSPNPHLQQSSKPKATNATKSPPTQRSNATEVTAKDDDVLSDDSTNPYHSDEDDNHHHHDNKQKNNPTATSPTPLAAPSIETTSGSVASGSKLSHGGGSKRSLHSAATPPSAANRSPTPTAVRPHVPLQSPRSNKSTPQSQHHAKQASPTPRRPTPNSAPLSNNQSSNKSLQNGIPTTLHIPEMRPPSPMASPRPLPHDPPQPTAVAAPDMSPYRELQQQQQLYNNNTVPQPPNLLSTTPNRQSQQQQQQQRVVRSFSQKAAATSPGSHKSAEVSAASSSSIIPDTDAPPTAESTAPESVPPKATNPESAAAPKEKFPPKTRVPRGARGLFGRSSRSNTPLARSTTPAGTASAAAAAAAPAAAPNDPTDRRAPSRGRSWLGSFRGKPVKGKPEALVVVSPELANNERSTSVGSAASRGSFTARVVLAATRRGSSHHKRPAPQSIVTDKETPVEDNNNVDTATTQLVQSLTKDPNAQVTRQTAETALQELQTLQTELGTLRQSQPPPSVQRVEHLQEELVSAQKAASQLESLNKSYRKTQKQMLHDLQEAQAELEKYHDLKLNASFSGEAQQLAEELASTMAELLALREQHEALLRQTTTANHNTRGGDNSTNPNGLAGGKDSDGYYQHETQLNLQKDLAHAMATISKLEEENDLLRQQVQKLESMEEAVAKLKMERDEYASQVQDQKIYGGPSGGAPSAAATATIDRLQTEKKQLLSNELALKQRLTKLETKNKNQKEIFKTAVEIKDVEFQINKKERDVLASRLEEVEQERTTQAEVHQQEVERLDARVKEVQADHKQSKAQVRLATEQAQQLARELEVKQGEVEVLTKNQDEFEAKEAALNHRIQELEEEMERKQEEIAGLEERARLETFKARRVMEDKVGELQEQLKEREATLADCQEQVQTLQEELQENRGEVERLRRRHSSLTRRSGDGDDDTSSQRLSALRSRIDNHETTLRSRMDTIRNMESPPTKRRTYSPAEEARPLELSSDTLENSAVADEELEDSHLVLEEEDDDARVTQLEGELGVAKSRIEELEAELASKHEELEDAKTDRSAIQMRETEASDVESNDNDEDVQEIHRLETSLRESDERINQLKDQLKDARTRLLEAQSSTHSTASSDSHETTHIDASQAEAEIEALISQLAEKEEACCDLQKLVDEMERDQKNSEQALQETRSKLANTEEQLLEVSKHQTSPPSNDQPESTERITVLEQELRSSQARLVEADSKIEMLEEFIAQDDTDFSHGSSVVDVKHLQDTLAEKEKEISRLSKLAENGEKVEELQERLSASEKAAKDLEIQNEKLSKSQSSNGMNGTGAGDDDVMTRMKFLEEQNAAYAASLKALRIEIATRHEGTAFE